MKKNTRILAKATSTPLASIFGSGFLIIVPILAGAVGIYSVYAMAGVCLLAYSVGTVIRFNIKNAEPVLADNPPEKTMSFERLSDLALVLAYVVSVCLYLHILASFVLGSFQMDTEFNENILTTGIIVIIMIIGLTKGLDALSALEKWGLIITLAIIVLLVLGFAYYDWGAWKSASGIQLFQPNDHTVWETITIVAGTLIVVQGFETTRYLGDDFSADIRIKASRNSQIISTIVYVVFIAVSMPLVHKLDGKYDDNSLIALAGFASAILVAPLVIAAAVSQFSAAVADTLAATGNMEEVTNKKLKAKYGTILVGGGAIALSWSSNTTELIALASRAFAFYYLLQCLVAISVSKSVSQKIGFGLIALALAFITVFAVPAS